MIVIGYDLVSYLLHYSSARYVTFKELFVCKSNNKTGDFEMNPPDFFYLNTSFFRKTLHSLIPTFLSTRNENDRCDRKTHKKNVG